MKEDQLETEVVSTDLLENKTELDGNQWYALYQKYGMHKLFKLAKSGLTYDEFESNVVQKINRRDIHK